MRVSYRWLLDYVDCPWEPEELADRLTMSGLKVEGWSPWVRSWRVSSRPGCVGWSPTPKPTALYVAQWTWDAGRPPSSRGRTTYVQGTWCLWPGREPACPGTE